MAQYERNIIYSEQLDKAADQVAGAVFNHYLDDTQKQRLKGVLFEFAYALRETFKELDNAAKQTIINK